MARIALGLICLALLLGAPGCAWTETYRDFPPGARGSNSHNHHAPITTTTRSTGEGFSPSTRVGLTPRRLGPAFPIAARLPFPSPPMLTAVAILPDNRAIRD